MQRVRTMLKRGKPSKSPTYLKRNRDAEKKRKAQKRDRSQDARAKAKYGSGKTDEPRELKKERRKKDTRDHVWDANIRGNYTSGVTDEPLHLYQRPQRKDMNQFFQTEETDYEDQPRGYREKRDRIYDKETETEDNKANERRYRRGWDGPYEDEMRGRQYGEKRDWEMYSKEMEYYNPKERKYRHSHDEPYENKLDGRRYSKKKDRAMYEIGPSMDEYQTDGRKYRDREHDKYQFYKSEPDCSASGSECSGTEFRRQGSGSERPWDSADYDDYDCKRRRSRRGEYEDISYMRLPTDHSVYRAHKSPSHARRRRSIETDYETYSGSDYHEEGASEATEYIEYNTDRYKGSTDYAERAWRDGRADRDERYWRKSKPEQRSRGFRQEPQVYVAHTEKVQTAFEQQQGEHHSKANRFPDEDSISSKVIYLPIVTDDNGHSRPCKREMSQEEMMAKAKEEPAEKPFEENMQIYTATDIEQANMFENAAKEARNTRIDGSVLALPKPINVQTSQEEGNTSEKIIASDSLDTRQANAGSEPSAAIENPNRKTDESTLLFQRPINSDQQASSIQNSQEEKNSARKVLNSSLFNSQHKNKSDENSANEDPFRKTFESFANNKFITVYTSQEDGNSAQYGMSSNRLSTQLRINEHDRSNPVRKSVMHVPSILKTRLAASEARRSVRKENDHMRDKNGSAEDLYTYENSGRKSENINRSSTRNIKNSVADDPRNSSERKSVQQRTISQENPRSQTLVRQVSGIEENIYAPKKPTKSHTLIRQISGTEEDTYSSNTNQNAGTKNMKRSMVSEMTGRNVEGSILKKNSPPSTRTKVSDGKGRESIASISRKQSRISKLFQRKKKKHSEDESTAESEELNVSGRFKQTSSGSNVINSYLGDDKIHSFLIWGHKVPFVVNLFSAIRIFLGLTVHDSMINVLNNGYK